MTTISSEWISLVKSFGIDRIPRSQRGFIGNMLVNAVHQRKSQGTLSTLLKKQETSPDK